MPELKLKEVRSQLREMNDEQLTNEVSAQYAEIYSLRRQNSMKTLTNTAGIRVARKQIARVKTLQREREIAAQSEAK